MLLLSQIETETETLTETDAEWALKWRWQLIINGILDKEKKLEIMPSSEK